MLPINFVASLVQYPPKNQSIISVSSKQQISKTSNRRKRRSPGNCGWAGPKGAQSSISRSSAENNSIASVVQCVWGDQSSLLPFSAHTQHLLAGPGCLLGSLFFVSSLFYFIIFFFFMLMLQKLPTYIHTPPPFLNVCAPVLHSISSSFADCPLLLIPGLIHSGALQSIQPSHTYLSCSLLFTTIDMWAGQP